MSKRVFALFLLIPALPALAQDPPSKISPSLQQALAETDEAGAIGDGDWGIWVRFTDKGLTGNALEAALATAEQNLPERTLRRRAKVTRSGERFVTVGDLPLAPTYLEAVTATGARPRRQSRWLNAASYDATGAQIAAIGQLPFVAEVSLVARFVRDLPEATPAEKDLAQRIREEAAAQAAGRWMLDYGGSTAGLQQINVPPVHELGLSGEGIIVGMLDSGFRTTHEALENITVIDQWDFVDDDPIVDEEPGDPLYSARHGTQTLSVLMGFMNGELVGPAFGAAVILARTEDIGDETPIEEDNWVAGLEWVESLGADLVSSSLGYYYWYEYSDLDGNTALCTVAADAAVARGLGVFTSAGNERQNAEWPHITTPADGDSVVAMAAVELDGTIASFSSPGPTYDGRIKPDLSAQGVGNFVASYYEDHSYHTADGTSFACPLVAGVAALMLERLPALTPMQIREALRMTADRAENPDNDYGWGIVDAYAAATYWGPSFVHEPLGDTEDTIGPYVVTCEIDDRQPLDPSSLYVYWRADGGAWQQVALNPIGGNLYSADIPGQPGGGLVEYYLEAGDTMGFVVQLPHNGPDNALAFTVGADLILPTLFHAALIDQIPTHWPPTVTAVATDNLGIDRVELTYTLNGGPTEGPFQLIANDVVYELAFPAGLVQIGDELTYQLTAYDTATVPNQATSGPFTFFVVADLGSVLVIKDDPIGADPSADDAGAAVGGMPAETNASADLLAAWLADAGYLVDLVDSDNLSPGQLDGYDAVALACGNNSFPVGDPQVRAALIDWVEGGGRLLVESGAIGEIALYSPGYPDFAQTVLHADEWWGDFYFEAEFFISAGYEQHYYLHRPHRLPSPVTLEGFGYDFHATDIVRAAPDAVPILRSVYNADTGGVLLYDDNTGPEAGQIVYFTFDLSYMDEALGRAISENALAYLLGREAPGTGSISGTVTLADNEDASGVTVSAGSGNSVVTGPDGVYTITGLHGATYNVTAERDGYGPVTQVVVLAQDEAITGVDFLLQPIVEVSYTESPELPIPDNDPVGVSSTITVAETGEVYAITVDIDVSHPSIGQLIVTLTSPNGTEVTLHNLTGGIADDIVGNWPETLSVDGPGDLADFVGEAVTGDWTLNVADTVWGAFGGILHSWGVNLQLVSPGVSSAPDAESEQLPQVTRITGNVPNPFNPTTVIAFELSAPGPVQLDIFDLRGHQIQRVVNGELPAGRHEVTWDGCDGEGRAMASGVYFCRLQATEAMDLHKMTLVR